MMIYKSIQDFSRMIKLSHTVFALPFALVAVIIIWQQGLAQVTWLKTLYIVLAFTGMRSFSMAVNRLADAKIDAQNPRTANREIPAGVLHQKEVWIFAGISMITVWVCAWLLTPVAFLVSFPAMVLLAGYSYAKRFTWLCHIWLGAVIGMAPLAVYIALAQVITPESLVLFVILMTYISGFDILYSIQDMEFDKKMNLYSMPSRLGIDASLWISTALHVVSVIGVFYLGYRIEAGIPYYAGAIVILAMIAGEHLVIGWGKILKKDKIPAAFFNYNSIVSLAFLIFTFLDMLFD